MIEHLYGERHLVECYINKMKHYRHIFSRFDKLAKMYLAFLHFVEHPYLAEMKCQHTLGNLAEVGGIGGGAEYFNENATIYFSDDDRIVGYDIAIGITSSATGGLPALLGRDIFDNWHIEYERRRGMLHSCSSSSLARADIANRYSLLATSNHSHSTPWTGCGGFGVHSRDPHDGHRHSS